MSTELERSRKPGRRSDADAKPSPDLKPPPKAYVVAMRLLARRDHSSAELRQKLHRRGCDENDISATLTTLAERGWQSDERFARGAVEGRARRGQGPRRIQLELQRAGLAPTLIQSHLHQADVDWQTEAIALAQKYLKGKDGADRAVQLKLYAFLQRRGYTGEQTSAVLKHLRAASNSFAT